MSILSILTLNIGNPSIERARSQVQWLEGRSEDVFVLTETKNSDGCKYIAEYFGNPTTDLFSPRTTESYDVYYPKSSTGDLGVMIISRVPIENRYSIYDLSHRFYARFAACDILFNGARINIVGLYVPSRDSSEERIKRKKDFCIDVANHIKDNQIAHRVICGDLNILDRGHTPHYSIFQDWEYRFYEFFINQGNVDAFRYYNPNLNDYTWVGRTNDGYRYDYFFVSNLLASKIVDCHIIHETRTSNRITDHSAVLLKLEW
ncbi:hypothetical protein HQ50_00545 [Porphyromonas sp. COT-052 OH4946]|uniref:endonuclease/exonuclease/phosphatase family protein n=1 Tax=Porphyromonas sp. COT-052 OH4946 TaxID=1515618 RepID=UPI00051CCD2A|nr:endonuclease/exonuclease/phosphatase family protein [Porphyromonas sp. COT-052 OH4946]KGL56835.1 hypothetical protein HQ50_00545 [Porphyromonas sp. COT-052 OH4946]